MEIRAILLVLSAACTASTAAFVATTQRQISHPSLISPIVLKNGASGGWGIGNSRDLTPEEFAKGGDRRAFEGYKLADRGEFMRKVKQDKEAMKMGEMEELLSVAKLAGIDVKDPSERLNRFDSNDLFLDDDDEDIDVSVQWDAKIDSKKDAESITRMDEDTGALGEW